MRCTRLLRLQTRRLRGCNSRFRLSEKLAEQAAVFFDALLFRGSGSGFRGVLAPAQRAETLTKPPVAAGLLSVPGQIGLMTQQLLPLAGQFGPVSRKRKLHFAHLLQHGLLILFEL